MDTHGEPAKQPVIHDKATRRALNAKFKRTHPEMYRMERRETVAFYAMQALIGLGLLLLVWVAIVAMFDPFNQA